MSEQRSAGGGLPPTTIGQGSTEYFEGSRTRSASQGQSQGQGQGGADQAKQKASQAAGQAQEKATQVAGQAQEKASQAADTAKQKAGQVADQASAKADQGMDKAAGGLDQAADMLRQKGEQMGQGSAVSSIATQAATQLDSAAQFLKDKDTDQLMTDLEDLVRRKPTQTLLVAAGVGFLLSKVVR